jgi:GNAT superfamily N-acetyltransferase
MKDEIKLDNPVWHSLSETHQDLAIKYNNIRFYHPDYCPFGAIEKGGEHSEYLDDYSKLIDNFFIVGKRPVISNKLNLKKELICLQMVLPGKIESTSNQNIIQLNATHSDELFKLVNEIQPGYFMKKTFLLGDYFGIFKNGHLVAVTGERMKMKNYTEVSAIVTHPNYRGKGYARQLIAHTVNNVISQDKKAFLHVAENNISAINLYESIGFITRRKISFWNVVRQGEL